MTKKRETLTVERVPFQFQLDPKSDFESGRFTGLASVFGSVIDTFPKRTLIKPGAFLKTINSHGNRVKILSSHDQGSIWIGLPTSIRETDAGLQIEVSLNNTSLGKDAAEALRHAASLGKLDAAELSIGFDSLADTLVEGEDEELFREISELRLWEVSLVNFGADRKTTIMEAARYDLDRQLAPKHREEALALAIAHSLDSLEEMKESDSALPPTAERILTNAYLRFQKLLGVQATGPAIVPPTDEPTLEELEVELVEAEAMCLELVGAIDD